MKKPPAFSCTFMHLCTVTVADRASYSNVSCFLFPTHLSAFADVSEDDIKLVMEQAQVNRAQAIKALQEHGYALSYPPP